MDLVECLVGSEIYSNPVQHVRIKPPEHRLPEGAADVLVRANPWHQDNGVVSWRAADATRTASCATRRPGPGSGRRLGRSLPPIPIRGRITVGAVPSTCARNRCRMESTGGWVDVTSRWPVAGARPHGRGTGSLTTNGLYPSLTPRDPTPRAPKNRDHPDHARDYARGPKRITMTKKIVLLVAGLFLDLCGPLHKQPHLRHPVPRRDIVSHPDCRAAADTNHDREH